MGGFDVISFSFPAFDKINLKFITYCLDNVMTICYNIYRKKLKGVVLMRITLEGLERKFNKELGYKLKSSAFSFIIDSLNELMLDIYLDDIDVYPGPGPDCMRVSYYGYYHVCNLYKGVHY